MLFKNPDINRLTAHSTLHRLAWGGSGVFSGIFLYREGVSPAGVFLAFAAIYALRFAFRPLVLLVVPKIGLRRALALGTVLQAIQYPMLALVQGPGLALLPFCAVTALGAAFYFTCYHAMFGAVGDNERRGTQVGVRQVLSAVAAILGPAVGGILLTTSGPWVAFGTAAAIEIAAIVPIVNIVEPPVEPAGPGGLASAKTGILLFFADGWISSGSLLAWNLIMFQSLDMRFDKFGEVLAAAAFAGALGGMVLGRFIDTGHSRRATWISATILAACLIAKAACGTDPTAIVVTAVVTTVFGGLYIPLLMTAFYNEAKVAPCPLRFQAAAEGGWDVGSALVSLVAAASCAAHAPLQVVILIAMPMVIVQAYLLDGSYTARPLRAASQN
jgi:DHA1 family inner membrane transport protein